jgi:hypothetical protein
MLMAVLLKYQTSKPAHCGPPVVTDAAAGIWFTFRRAFLEVRWTNVSRLKAGAGRDKLNCSPPLRFPPTVIAPKALRTAVFASLSAMTRSSSFCCVIFTFGLSAGFAAAAEPGSRLEYNRDVRPILSEFCFACHGPDSAARKADLRLDQRDMAIGMAAIVPGDPEGSDAGDEETAFG